MHRSLRTLAVAAAIALMGGLLTTGSAVAGDDPAMTGAPAVGACYDLTWQQTGGMTAGEDPVACSGRHTVAVTAIGTLPAALDYQTMDPNDLPDALFVAVRNVCGPAATKAIANPVVRARTLWQDFWFAPSDTEIATGARWFSCMTAMEAKSQLVPLKKGQPARIKGKIPNAVAKCAVRSKGSFANVPCTSKHQWRATYSVLVKKSASQQSADRAAGPICTKKLHNKTWLYSWVFVTPKSFVLVCSNKTTH